MQLMCRTAYLATTGTVHNVWDGGLGRNAIPGRILLVLGQGTGMAIINRVLNR